MRSQAVTQFHLLSVEIVDLSHLMFHECRCYFFRSKIDLHFYRFVTYGKKIPHSNLVFGSHFYDFFIFFPSYYSRCSLRLNLNVKRNKSKSMNIFTFSRNLERTHVSSLRGIISAQFFFHDSPQLSCVKKW